MVNNIMQHEVGEAIKCNAGANCHRRITSGHESCNYQYNSRNGINKEEDIIPFKAAFFFLGHINVMVAVKAPHKAVHDVFMV